MKKHLIIIQTKIYFWTQTMTKRGVLTVRTERDNMGNNIQLHELMTCLRDTVNIRIMSNNGHEILSGEVGGIKSLKGFHHSNVHTVMTGLSGLTLYIDDFSDEKGERIENGI